MGRTPLTLASTSYSGSDLRLVVHHGRAAAFWQSGLAFYCARSADLWTAPLVVGNAVD